LVNPLDSLPRNFYLDTSILITPLRVDYQASPAQNRTIFCALVFPTFGIKFIIALHFKNYYRYSGRRSFYNSYRGNREMKYFNVLVIALNLVLALTSLAAVAAEAPASKEHLVMQVSDADPGKWNLALNNAKNLQQAYGADKIEIEIVTYGPGVNMLKLDSVVANRIEEAKQAGVAIVACQNTMRGMKLTESDMLPNTSYVPAGVVEIIKKQREGYAYIRP
jgi:uncharacterized protein